MSLGEYFQVKRHFIQNGHLPVSAAPDTLERNMLKEMNVLAYCDRMGKVGAEGKSGYVMLGYDDIYAIEYFMNLYWRIGNTRGKWIFIRLSSGRCVITKGL